MTRIAVVGTGYVGLVTGVGLAAQGHDVVCVEKDVTILRVLETGQAPIYEPNLEALLQQVREKGCFRVQRDLRDAILQSEVTIVCVGTPDGPDGVNLSALREAAGEIGKALREKAEYSVVAVKSTVPPTTTESVILPDLEESSGRRAGEFGLCVNPEFLREGQALADFLQPDRIVIGEWDRRSGDGLEGVYRPFGAPIIRTNLATAEMIKYASNALLANLISFSNELANLCAIVPDLDVAQVLGTVGQDQRLNPRLRGQPVNPEILSYLAAGCGFGGSCLSKDLRALIAWARHRAYNPALLSAILDINARQPMQILTFLEGALPSLQGKRIAVLGLAFKPGTDDLRESPALVIIPKLLEQGAHVVVYDPVAMPKAQQTALRGVLVEYARSAQDALREADAAVVVTGWPEFANISPQDFRRELRTPILIDGRRLYEPVLYARELRYFAIGVKLGHPT